MKRKSLIFSLLLLLCSLLPLTGAQKDDVVRILAIGNSFSQDAVEQYFWNLADADGVKVIVGNMYIGGCSLERHVNNLREDKADYAYRKIGLDGKRVETRNMTLEKALADEDWDYVSLQQASPLSGKFESFETFLPELASYVRERVGRKTRLMWHQTWAYAPTSGHSGFRNYGNDQMTMYNAICDASMKAMKLAKIKMVIPSGTAIQNARTSFVGDDLTRDGYHLGLGLGRYIAACTWYEAVLGRDVTGNSYRPDKVSEWEQKIAQRAAHEAVKNSFSVTDLSRAEENIVYKDARADVESRVEDLLSRMTLEEKIYQLNQYVLGRNDNVNNIGETVSKIPAAIGSLIYFSDDAELRNAMQREAMEHSRLGIPVLFGFDVIHGFRTIYQISLGQAASWNPDLVEMACAVAAQEAYSAGIDWTFSPMVDVARDPRWGRISEGYGEDPYTNSVFAAASVKGYQGDDLAAENTIAACLKHYVGYGASEAGRDYVPTEISRQTLWDTYLPSFEAGIKAGAATVMSSFNNISGIPASANRYTMTEVLKEKWGHDGFIVSDWDAIRQLINQGMAKDGKEAAELAFNAGLEMDMVDDLYRKHLPALIEEGKVKMEDVDEYVRRVLRLKFRLGLFEKPYTVELPDSQRILLPQSLEVAERLAAESMVLLKNGASVLPLKASGRIALIGPLADNQEDFLGNWSARGKAEDVIGIREGLAAEFGDKVEILYAKGCDFEGDDTTGFAEAVKLASESDVVVLCIGEKRIWSGENTSRSTIALPEIQEELLYAVEKAGKPVVVLLASGRPLDLARIEPHADAILEMWQPGVRTGNAVAGLLSGRYNPSGKLAVTFPYTSGQIPIYYNRRNSGRRGTQGIYKDIQSTPLYEFGHGLSYSTFEYSPVTVSSDRIGKDGALTASVTVKNVSGIDGMETVHWFICDPYSHITRPVRELKHFEKQMIRAGESRTFTFEIDPLRDLGFVNENGERYLDAGDYYIIAGDRKVKVEVTE